MIHPVPIFDKTLFGVVIAGAAAFGSLIKDRARAERGRRIDSAVQNDLEMLRTAIRISKLT